jgi:N-carbamoyl-L-amino-acid hydrolase
MPISQSRLKHDILTNGSFGELDTETGHGRTVLTGSTADKEARDYFTDQLSALDMTVRVDPVGNIVGRWVPETADPSADPVAAGSHLDSVPHGGIFDGPLGVYAALEAVRSLQEDDVALERPLEIVSFTEEEGGRFGIGLLGSSVVNGEREPEAALSLTDDTGVSLREHLEEIGYSGTAELHASSWDSFLEVHVEQSRVLETKGIPIGIVTAITGITNCRITITGEADHAGTTSMTTRRDALVAAADFVQSVNEISTDIVETTSEFAVGTVGEFEIEPNVRNVIPGRVRLSTDFRDTELSVMDSFVDQISRELARIEDTYDVETHLDRYRTLDPRPLADHCISAFESASNSLSISSCKLPSGAAHDTANIATVTDAGLLFVPSTNGILHSPEEWTEWEDCTRAATVLKNAITTLA